MHSFVRKLQPRPHALKVPSAVCADSIEAPSVKMGWRAGAAEVSTSTERVLMQTIVVSRHSGCSRGFSTQQCPDGAAWGTICLGARCGCGPLCPCSLCGVSGSIATYCHILRFVLHLKPALQPLRSQVAGVMAQGQSAAASLQREQQFST